MSVGCPPPGDLERLGGDSLDPGGDAYRAIEAHVEGCPSCRQRLERLARVDLDLDEPTTAVVAEPGPPTIPGYTIGRRLGRGGGGVVFEAEQRAIGRRVAVKVLASGPALDPRARDRWLREARAIGRVRHPNVVRLHEAGEHEGRLFLVLDLIPGGSLRDRIAGPLPPREAARLVRDVARAVEAIHGAGLLHLDVKPSNILLDGPPGADWPALTPLLADFGVAIEELDPEATATGTGTVGPRGTPGFMSPEQVAGRRRAIGPAADVYALGATLYALLTGRPPFQAASTIETLDLIRHREPASPRSLVPGLPRDLETVCLQAIRKDPARRYKSAAAMAEDLDRWLGGFPVRARPVTNVEHLARWCRRNPFPAALAATLAATVLASLIGLTALWRRAGAERDRALQSEAAAQEAIGELVDQIVGGLEAPEQRFGDRVGVATPVVLGLIDELRRDPRRAAAHAPGIARLAVLLSNFPDAHDRPDEARRPLDAAAALLRPAAEARPPDPEAAIAYAEVLIHRGWIAQKGGWPAEAEDDARRAEAALGPFLADPRALSTVIGLADLRTLMARGLADRGDAGAARRIAAENARFCRALHRDRPGNPTFGLLAALADRPESPSGSALAIAADALRRFPEGGPLPEALAGMLGAEIAMELIEAHVGDPPPDGDPDAVAGAIFGAIDERFAGLRLDPALERVIVRQLSEQPGVLATTARHEGRLDEARRVVAVMFALARAYERRRPDSIEALWLFSKAYEQESKFGWETGDREAVERNLRRALVAATWAFAGDPSDDLLRRHVAATREKFVRLVSEEP